MNRSRRSRLRTRTDRRLSLLAVVAMALPLAALGVTNVSATETTTVGPYTIDGTVPDSNGTPPVSTVGAAINDISGSTKELGPINGTTTKIGVIHTDAVPTLGFTNPNGQVDLNQVWLDLRRVGASDYLYFAWQRDANSGSGFIAYEFMRAAAPTACAYSSATEAALTSGCNPWANRAAGDFMILWDQQGGNRDLVKRVWGPEGAAGSSLVLGAGVALGTNSAAHYSADGFRGEAAVNLTAAGLTTGSDCLTLANTIPSTVTGNSDTADYKDTVLTTKSLTTCAAVNIVKVDDATPANIVGGAVFKLFNNVAPLDPPREAEIGRAHV